MWYIFFGVVILAVIIVVMEYGMLKETKIIDMENHKIKQKLSDIENMRSLLDGAYDIVELWKAETPAQEKWKKRWMEKARKFGAEPTW